MNSRKKIFIGISGLIVLTIITVITLIIVIRNDQASKEASADNTNLYITNSESPIIGAIRYDAWFSPPNYGNENKLTDPKWHHRLPFYARITDDGAVEVRGDSQEIVDQEILFAAAGGLDYWAFNYYNRFGLNPREERPSAGDLNYGLRYYLKSDYKTRLNFCLNISGSWAITSPETWNNNLIPNVVGYMSDESYQTVINGRPLLYVYKISDLEKQIGGEANLKKAIADLRKSAIESGLKDPYIVGMLWDYYKPSGEILNYGFDAVSNYTASRGNDYNDGILWPYSKLTESNVNFWNRLASEGAEQVPIMNVGWDYRPNVETANNINPIETYGQNPLYETPTPVQIGEHLKNTISWVGQHRKSVKSNTILMYSWAEYPEGGWLNPTLLNGDDRLRALAEVLGVSYEIEYVDKFKHLQRSDDEVVKTNLIRQVDKTWTKGKPYLSIKWYDNSKSLSGFKYYWVTVLDLDGKRIAGAKVVDSTSINVDFDLLDINSNYKVVVQAVSDKQKLYDSKRIYITDRGYLK